MSRRIFFSWMGRVSEWGPKNLLFPPLCSLSCRSKGEIKQLSSSLLSFCPIIMNEEDFFLFSIIRGGKHCFCLHSPDRCPCACSTRTHIVTRAQTNTSLFRLKPGWMMEGADFQPCLTAEIICHLPTLFPRRRRREKKFVLINIQSPRPSILLYTPFFCQWSCLMYVDNAVDLERKEEKKRRQEKNRSRILAAPPQRFCCGGTHLPRKKKLFLHSVYLEWHPRPPKNKAAGYVNNNGTAQR